MNALTLLALAIAPGLAISLFIYSRDKLDREPFRLLLISFVLGMVSIIPAVVLEMLAAQAGLKANGHWIDTGYYAFMVGVVEEVCKYAFVIWFAYPKKEFNEPFDGITYCIMVGMGFATLENILYVFQGGWDVALLRMFTAVPAHATFAVLMGYSIGLAKFKPASSLQLHLTGLLTAILFHTAYDYFLFLTQGSLLVLGAVVSLVVAVLLSFRAMRLHSLNSPFATSPNTPADGNA